MSLTLKLSSLVIRTLSKPIANQIKAQAREHERFRNICVSMAQGLHRLDMRLRLGTIRDNASAQRRAAADAELRKHKPTTPTAKTEADARAEEEAIAKAKEAEKPAPKPHIRPLSESKAIESGATVISETFLFLVAGGLILFESWRSRRKETTRRDDVAARLKELEESEIAQREAFIALEKEVLQLRAKHGELPESSWRILPRVIWEVKPEPAAKTEQGWFSTVSSYFSSSQSPEQQARTESEESEVAASKAPTSSTPPVPTASPEPAPSTNKASR
ncbi:optic atrophy 3 protein-domain-containing protein [Aspergillus cavernicola]|uniref:Optic atrophy 3 protein-domain-containing protein n=1 Tax=Aspergillus cavernicola TaxID=176166 RepID=A0ABR4IXY2_9EURO